MKEFLDTHNLSEQLNCEVAKTHYLGNVLKTEEPKSQVLKKEQKDYRIPLLDLINLLLSSSVQEFSLSN